MPDRAGRLILAAAALAAAAPGAWGQGVPSLSTAAAPSVSTAAAQKSLDQVTAALRDADAPPARLEAAAQLRGAAYRGPRAFRSLAAAAHTDLNNEVRREAAIALLDYEGYQTLSELEKYLADELSAEDRVSVCAALATAPAFSRNPGATSLLSARLAEDAAAPVRLAAVEGLRVRQDVTAQGDLLRAGQKDPDARVRAAALAAFKKVSAPPKVVKPKPKPVERAPYDAVKGKDHCPAGSGWCDCTRLPLKMRPRCIPRVDCEHLFFNSYQRQGFICIWNGEQIQ